MRVNIYCEELTRDTVVLRRKVGDATFYGARLMLRSPTELQTTGADDRSAVTFWFDQEDVCERFADAIAGVLRRADHHPG